MVLVLSDDRIGKATNTKNGAVLTIGSTSDERTFRCSYSSPLLKCKFALYIKRAPPDLFVENDPELRPLICILANELIGILYPCMAMNAEELKRILYEIVAMIGFISKHHPITNNYYVWSDFEYAQKRDPGLAKRLNGFVPSNRELLEVSCSE